MSKVRVTLDLTRQSKERLDRLEIATDAISKAAVIREALGLYEYVAGRVAAGFSFKAVSPTGLEETIILPGLSGSASDVTRLGGRNGLGGPWTE